MIIRKADFEDDALAIMDGARDFISRVAFRDLMPDDDGLVKAIAKIISLDGLEILVAEHDGQVVAGIGLLFQPWHWNPDILLADELFWWAAQDAPFRAAHMLMVEAMRVIDEKQALPVFRALETSPDGVARMYQRMGLKPIETVYMGGL